MIPVGHVENSASLNFKTPSVARMALTSLQSLLPLAQVLERLASHTEARMSKTHFFGTFFMLFWGFCASASAQIIEEPNFAYQAQRGNADLIQLSISIQPVANISQVPAYADPYQLHNNQDGIRKFAMVRSTFTLKLGLEEIKKRTQNPLDLSSRSKKFKVNSCADRDCEGYIVTSFAKNNVSFTSAVMERGAGGWENTFKALNDPDLIVAQRFTKIQYAFASGSNFTAFYKINENETWVQSFQFFMIRESAYGIPFLERMIREIMKDMLLDGRSAILQQ